MARNRFPGKPAKITLPKRQRVISKKFALNKENLVLNENVSRGISCFYSLIGDSDEDEDFHGFTEKEIQFANLKSEYLQSQTDRHTEAFWAAKGVALDPADREEILKNSGVSTYHRTPLRLSNGTLSHKKKATPSTTTNQDHQALPQKRDSKGLNVSPKNKQSNGTTSSKNKQSTPKTNQEITEVHFENNLSKPKPEIQLPSWRRIVSPYKSRMGSDSSNDDEDIEDMSDEVFVTRHKKAEEEEQELWEKWQAKRLEDGKAISGRSKSSGWREPDLGLNTPRLRSQRVSSMKSECSTPGRLSPATVERVKEICVEPSTPPYLIKTLHKAFDKSNLSHKVLKESCITPFKPNDKIKLFNSSAHRSPRTRIQEKFRMTTGNDQVSEDEENEIVENKNTEENLKENSFNKKLPKCKEMSKPSLGEISNVRRSKSDTTGMRRSSPREQTVPESTVLKNAKENIACQLMQLAVGSSNERASSKPSPYSLPESPCRSESANSMNRVLKDSNVEKSTHGQQASRQATKKTILSQKLAHRNSYAYPLRSQALSRRTRQGGKR